MAGCGASRRGLGGSLSLAFDARALRYFVQVAELGSLSRAARALCVAQPALSQQMAGLEDHLGVKLFVRSHRGMSLTPDGTRLHKEALGLLDNLKALEESFQAGNVHCTGQIRIGMPAATAVWLVPPLVGRVREHHPGLLLHVKEAMTPVLLDGLTGGDLDVVIAAEAGDPGRVLSSLLVEEAIFLVGPADGRLGERVAFAQVTDLPLIRSSLPTGTQTVFDEHLARLGGKKLNIVLESASLSANKRLIADHGLYGLMAWSAVREDVERGLLTAARLIEPEISRPLYLCRLANRNFSPALAAVNRAVEEVIRIELRNGRIL